MFVFFRYDLASMTVYDLMLRGHVTFMLANMWFLNLHTLLRYVQVVVWNRVREINEDVAASILFRVTFFNCGITAFCIRFETPVYNTIAAFTDQQIDIAQTHCDNHQFDLFGYR